MVFKDKYAPDSEKAKPQNKDKKIISDDAFAIGEVIENKLEHIRQAFIK